MWQNSGAALASTLSLPETDIAFNARADYTIFGKDITTVDIDEIVNENH